MIAKLQNKKKLLSIISVVLVSVTVLSVFLIKSVADNSVSNTFDYIKTLQTKDSFTALEVVPEKDGNLFSFEDWSNDPNSATMINSTNGSFVDVDKESQTATVYDFSRANENYSKYSGSSYAIAVKPGTTYVFSFTLDTDVGYKNSYGQFVLFSYTSYSSGEECVLYNVMLTSGNYKYTYQAKAGEYYLRVRFGTGNYKNTTEFADNYNFDRACRYSDIECYESGNENIFDFKSWATNVNSKQLSGANKGGSVEFDTVNKTATFKQGATATNLYTGYGSSSAYYNMKVSPNTPYIIQFKVSGDNAKGQVLLFECNSSYGILTNIDYSSKNLTNGTYKFRFITGGSTQYLQLRMGCANERPNQKCIFSDLKINKDVGFYSNTNNIFDFNKWAATGSGLVTSDTSSNGTITLDKVNRTICMKQTSTAAARGELYTNYGNSSDRYMMPCKPNTTYVFKYDIDEPDIQARPFIFEYTNSSCNNSDWSGKTKLNNHDFTGGGTKTYIIKTTANTNYLQFRFGCLNNIQTFYYRNIGLYEVSDIVDESTNGSLGVYAGGKFNEENLFSLSGWANSDSKNYGTGGSVSYDLNAGTIDVSVTTGNDFYTSYSGSTKFSMKVEPNTEYVYMYDISGENANGCTYVFFYEDSQCGNYGHCQGFGNCTPGSHIQTFTTGANDHYLQIRFGAQPGTHNQTTTYSNIRVYKNTKLLGQEPFSNLDTVLSKKSADQRSTYMSYIFNKINANGLTGTGNSTPLKTINGGIYSEYYPWQTDKLKDSIEIKLDHIETGSAKGDYVRFESGERTDDYAYNAVYDYSYVNGLGSYKQNVNYYKELTQDEYNSGNEKYTYNVTFSEFDVNTEYPEGMPVYKKTGSAYTFFGYLGEIEVILDGTEKYYIASSDGRVYDIYASDHKYIGIYDYYVPVDDGETGYFNEYIKGYKYDGPAAGNYKFVPSSSGSNMDVEYDKIYIKLPYSNNEWFRQYVLNCSKAQALNTNEGNVKVQTVTLSELNNNFNIVYNCDMIAFTADSVFGTNGCYLSDLTDNTVNSLKNYIQQNDIPVMCDVSVLNNCANAPKLESFVKTFLCTGKTTSLANTENNNISYSNGGVENNIYISNIPYSNNEDSIITTKFNTQFSADKYAQSGPYYDVVRKIEAENALRELKKFKKMDVYVSVATSIRSILYHQASAVHNNKDNVTILDIEPYTNKNGSGITGCLTEAAVRQWFNLDSDVTVNIKTMAAAEFISKIDDIVENFDAVYIGSSTYNMNVDTNGKPAYNDTNMNGMYYTNIGDIYYGINGFSDGSHRNEPVLGGYLDEEVQYRGGTSGAAKEVKPSDTTPRVDLQNYATKLRSSGNDLTPAKIKQVIEAADTGIPIIVADELVIDSFNTKSYVVRVKKTSGPTRTGTNYSVSLSADLYLSTDTSYSHPVTQADLPEGIEPKYFWYKSGDSKVISNDKSITVTVNTDSTYYCQVRFIKTTSSDTIRSNELSQILINSNTVLLKMQTVSYDVNIGYYDGNVMRGWRHQATISPDPGVTVKWSWKGGVSQTGGLTCKDETYRTVFNGEYAKLSIEIGDIKYDEMTVSKKPGCDGKIDDGYMTGYQKNSNRIYVVSYLNCAATVNNETGNGYIGTLYAKAEINPSAIDNSSNMYQCVNELLMNYGNVVSVSEAKKYADIMNRYLNLSNPKIVNEGGFDEYNENNPVSIKNNKLVFEFEITNPTDLTPGTTSYEGELRIDIDSDGIYSDDEVIADVEYYEITSGVKIPVSYDQIRQNGVVETHRYVAERILPSDFVGCIPWQFTVTKNGDANAHASTVHYSYNKPQGEKPTVKVLQVLKKNEKVDGTYSNGSPGVGSVFASDIFKGTGLNIYKGVTTQNTNILTFNSGNAVDFGNSGIVCSAFRTYTDMSRNGEICIVGRRTTSDPGSEKTIYTSDIKCSLKHGKTYKISFYSTNNYTDIYLMKGGGAPYTDTTGGQSDKAVLKDGLYYYEYTFTCGVSNTNDYSWTSDSSATYGIRVDIDRYDSAYDLVNQNALANSAKGWQVFVISNLRVELLNEADSDTNNKLYTINLETQDFNIDVTVVNIDMINNMATHYGNTMGFTFTKYSNKSYKDGDDRYIKTSVSTWLEILSSTQRSTELQQKINDIYFVDCQSPEWLHDKRDYKISMTSNDNYAGTNQPYPTDELNTVNSLADKKCLSMRTLPEILNDYDMLVCGFGDCFATGVSMEAAKLISEVAKKDSPNKMSVLYTHDATNTNNNPYNDKTDLNDKGFYLNILVRPYVGLDRYGASYSRILIQDKVNNSLGENWGLDEFPSVDGVFGRTQNASKSYSGVYMYSTSYSDLSADSFLKNNYAVSYVPGSAKTQVDITSVHGYTRHTMTRYNMPVWVYGSGGDKDGNNPYGIMPGCERFINMKTPTKLGHYSLSYIACDYNKSLYSLKKEHSCWSTLSAAGYTEKSYPIGKDITTTTQVSQVNKGQITTYPYNVNVSDFKTTNTGTRTINTTHEQYYQLNVNDPDVITWYCLAGDNFSDVYNDAVNCYYIYTKDNITYTGAGHTNSFSLDEAKLFVNTLMASYKSEEVLVPDVSFRNADDTVSQRYMVLKNTRHENSDGTVSYVDEGKICVKVSNLTKSFDSDLGECSFDLFYYKSAADKNNDVRTYVLNHQVIEEDELYSFYLDYDYANSLADKDLFNFITAESAENDGTERSEFILYAQAYADGGNIKSPISSLKLRKVILKGLS